jgi:dihydrofolate synthase/folylpolyglutamate synthase
MGKINLPLPNLLGDFQISNVSTAIVAAKNLTQFKITEQHIKKAIIKIKSEGRLQVITQGKLRECVSKNNQILIDGAHNSLAASAVSKYLETLDGERKIFMVLGMMANKEHKEFIQIFKNRVHSIIALDIPNHINFIQKEKLSKIAQSCGIISKTENSIEEALKNIAKEDNNAIIFCSGSLYFASEILNLN